MNFNAYAFPEQPMPGYARLPEAGQIPYQYRPDALSFPLPPTPTDSNPASPSYTSSPSPTPSSPSSSARPAKVPRPPNAFLLYRSDLLARSEKLKKREKRQQNLSRVAGQTWNLLPFEEKKLWYAKARDIKAAHKRQHPDYQFRPAPKGSSQKAKSKGSKPSKKLEEHEISCIRADCLGISGPAIIGRRTEKRRNKEARGGDSQEGLGSQKIDLPQLQAIPPLSYSDSSATTSPISPLSPLGGQGLDVFPSPQPPLSDLLPTYYPYAQDTAVGYGTLRQDQHMPPAQNMPFGPDGSAYACNPTPVCYDQPSLGFPALMLPPTNLQCEPILDHPGVYSINPADSPQLYQGQDYVAYQPSLCADLIGN